mmetsp:Transcript_25490/g.42382  ORF Transcript_25490/g.42382 Transcript_25490/m.42382 type:complete len:677 (+) Transcript_25490:80-2110(+)
MISSYHTAAAPTMVQQKPSRRIAKMGATITLMCLAVVAVFSDSPFTFIRKLCSIDVYFEPPADEPYGTWQEFYQPAQAEDYEARAVQAAPEEIPPKNINFVISILECPDLDQHGVKENAPPNELFYDMISTLKYSLCDADEDTVIDGEKYSTTFQALIPSDAGDCMGTNGEPFDRVKVLEDLKIGVKLIGSPVDRESISSDCLRANVDSDVGVKDLIKLRAFNMTAHEVVVLVDYTTFVLQPLGATIGEFVKSSAKVAYAEDYTPWGTTPSDNKSGVNSGFIMIKPSQLEFDSIVNMYKNTPYDCGGGTGWASSGVGGFPGAMGTSGILKHYYNQKPAGEKPTILNKCSYNNDATYHLADGVCRDGKGNCENCQGTASSNIVVAKLTDEVCGKPFACPDKSWPTGHICDKIHQRWFENRVSYEDNHLNGGNRAQRDGTFRTNINLGFCEKAGMDGYQKIFPDAETGPVSRPEPAAPVKKESCSITCNAGEYVTQDCTCTTDECASCPEGTQCQRKGKNGIPPMCIDCGCGFCDFAGNACCDFNGVNNCKSNTNKKECLLQNAYYPGWAGTGNACSGVEISATATPNGCGCQPNELTPCTYTPDPSGNTCFITTAHDLLTTSANYNDACKTCLDGCDPCISGAGQDDVIAMMNCLGKTIGKKREACRADCASVCKDV